MYLTKPAFASNWEEMFLFIIFIYLYVYFKFKLINLFIYHFYSFMHFRFFVIFLKLSGSLHDNFFKKSSWLRSTSCEKKIEKENAYANIRTKNPFTSQAFTLRETSLKSSNFRDKIKNYFHGYIATDRRNLQKYL